MTRQANMRPPSGAPTQRDRRQAKRLRWRRPVVSFCLSLPAILILILAGAAVWASQVDYADTLSRHASAALGRSVTVESVRLIPGRWLGVVLNDGRVANQDGGSDDPMLKIQSLQAEVDLLSLLHGPVVIRRVVVAGLSILLERDAEGRPNWRFGAVGPERIKASDRVQIPTVTGIDVRASELVFRTSSGSRLHVEVSALALASADPDQPMMIRATGAYNGIPAVVGAAVGSPAALRDVANPFPVNVHLTAGGTTLLFEGTATDPLKADGLAGRLSLSARGPSTILAIAGLSADLDVDVSLAGEAGRDGNLWWLSDVLGQVNAKTLTATRLQLTEGTRGQPDAIAAAIDLEHLDINRIAGKAAAPNQRGHADMSLALDPNQDPTVEADIGIARLTYARLEADGVRLTARLGGGRLVVDPVRLTTSGAEVSARADAYAQPDGSARVDANIEMNNADLDALRRTLGVRPLPLSGPLQGRIAVSAAGRSLNEAARQARISAVASMQGGRIARDVIEKGSTDVRRLVRRPTGTTSVSCLLGVLDMRAGVGRVAPLRIRAGIGTISGAASIDLNREWVDLVIGSQSGTTGFFALDIPVRVNGPFANPNISPARWSAAGRARLASADDIAPLPPELRTYARSNPCFSGGVGHR